jgi:hypothetical protein
MSSIQSLRKKKNNSSEIFNSGQLTYSVNASKIEYLCPGSPRTAHILNSWVSRWECSFEPKMVNQFNLQYTPPALSENPNDRFLLRSNIRKDIFLEISYEKRRKEMISISYCRLRINLLNLVKMIIVCLSKALMHKRI